MGFYRLQDFKHKVPPTLYAEKINLVFPNQKQNLTGTYRHKIEEMILCRLKFINF